MTTSHRGKWGGLVLAALVAQGAAAKPNILLILTDDMGYGDLSIHGNPVLKTPNIDRIGREGVRLRDFHVSPTCAPTRSALLTGRHEFRNGITHTILERERLTLDAVTLAEVLHKGGYTTGIFGKWHLGDETEYRPDRRGFDETFIHGGGGIGQTYPGSCGDAPGNRYTDPAILHNGVFEKTKGFCTDVFTSQAIRWMESVKDRPFFCYVPYNAAHGPLSCPEEYAAPYRGKVPDDTATFFGMIANIDMNAGRFLAKLDEWNIASNTIVLYMHDNGGTAGTRVFNAGLRATKGTPWLGGTKAPAFWRWPGTLPPHDVDALTAHIDIFPTLAELTGITLDDRCRNQIEGRSLVPLLRDGSAAWPDRVLFTHVGRWPKGADPASSKLAQCSVRDPRWHLVSEGKGGKGWQLFDVKADLAETTDVAAAHPDVVARLTAEYDRWWTSVQPALVNEKATGPKVNPFKELYWKQFGGGPSAAELEEMSPERANRFGAPNAERKKPRTDRTP